MPMTKPRFALIGAAGFVAPRHFRAIRDGEGELLAALDPHDSVGILDSYFPEARFFTEFERFDRHLDKLQRSGAGIDYLSICSPNYLHDAHVRYALRSNADAICEKPLVLNPWNLDGLQELENATGRRVWTILQLRLHEAVRNLKARVAAGGATDESLELTYITSRGAWYGTSWKGDNRKSGGIATNIGVHLFDMVIHVFGAVARSVVHYQDANRAGGYLECGKTSIRWFLSIDAADLPAEAAGKSTYRSVRLGSEEIEFSSGFTDLHSASYQQILAGAGYGIDEVRPSIELVSSLRTQTGDTGSDTPRHPLIERLID